MIDSANHFKVRSPDGGRTIYFETPTASPVLVKLSPEQTVNLCAWLFIIGLQGTFPLDFVRTVNEIKL